MKDCCRRYCGCKIYVIKIFSKF